MDAVAETLDTFLQEKIETGAVFNICRLKHGNVLSKDGNNGKRVNSKINTFILLF
jgi:hypothetical protein